MKSNDIETTGLIYEGLLVLLQNWRQFNEALSQKQPAKVAAKVLKLEGTDDKVRDKLAFYLIDTVANYEVEKEELRSDIAQIVKENFGATIDDGSDLEVCVDEVLD
eukprot:TRINITY_DN21363_c0_g1_i1.p1 TRINITY_DN21363_c0_g1~~TRINITY_DN21363_c0_g1_i1.p1  ORF type:complete len:113 (+),score=30.87 TRINITY_DN21363_c0_g1_i1:24-341(+)